MVSVIWDKITDVLSEVESFIREIDSHFLKGLSYVLMWLFIIGLFLGLIWLTIVDWKTTAWIVGIALAIEILCWIGRKLED